MRIVISISDPWDLGEAIGWRPLRGELLQTANDEYGGKGLIKLDIAVTYRGSSRRYVVASPRHQGKQIAEIQSGTSVLCAFTGISDEEGEKKDLLAKNWRGGLAFIGELQLAT